MKGNQEQQRSKDPAHCDSGRNGEMEEDDGRYENDDSMPPLEWYGDGPVAEVEATVLEYSRNDLRKNEILRSSGELRGLVWDMPGGAVWVGPKELLWMANNYRVAKKLDGRQVIVAKALEDCVERVIKEARSYHVGNSSRFSLTLTNQTAVDLAKEKLNLLAQCPAS